MKGLDVFPSELYTFSISFKNIIRGNDQWKEDVGVQLDLRYENRLGNEIFILEIEFP
jgi:hypothetical protein